MGLKDLDYKPATKTVRIVFDDTLVKNLEDARRRLAAEKRRDDPALGTEAQDAVDAAEAAADEAAVDFTFQAIPRHEMAELVAQCPPSSDELATWKEQSKGSLLAGNAPAWSTDTFPPKLIGASLVKPETTIDEVQELWDEGSWSEAIWNKLWEACWSVNQETTTRPTSGIGSA